MSIEQPPLLQRGIGGWFLRHRSYVLLAIMVIIIPATQFASQIKTDNAIERWMGDDDQAVRTWDAFTQRYHIQPELTVVLEDVLPTDKKVEHLARLMEQQKFVSKVWTPHRLQALLASISQQAQSGQLDDYSNTLHASRLNPPAVPIPFAQSPLGKLMIPEGKSTTLWIEVEKSYSQNSQQAVLQLRQAGYNAHISVSSFHIGGPLVINAALDFWSVESLKLLLPFAGLLCLLLLHIMDNSLLQSALLMFSAALTVFITFAVMSATGTKLNLLLIALPALIGVLHLSVGIHIVHHFHHWRTQIVTAHADENNLAVVNSQAITGAFTETFLPASLAMVTTAIGMLSLLTSDLEIVRSFGVWSSIGLIISFFVAYLFLPCFLIDASGKPTEKSLSGQFISPRFRWRRGLVFAVTLGLLLSAVPGWMRLKSDLNAIHFLPAHCQTLLDYKFIEQKCCGLIPIEIDVSLAGISSPEERLHLLTNLGRKIAEHPDVTHALSSASLLGTVGMVMPVLRNDQRKSLPLFLKHWRSEDGNHFRISALVRSDSPRKLGTITSDIHHILGNTPHEVTGLISLIDRSQHAIFKSLRDSLLLACGLIGLILIVMLRSVLAGLIAMIPNIAPILIGFGFMGWMGIPLGIGTVLTASIALGIALDDTLHFLHQFRQASARSNNRECVIRRTWQACSWPMIQTSFVTAAGLAVLGISLFRPVAHFGQLMAILLLLALLADLLLLPYLLTTRVASLFWRNST